MKRRSREAWSIRTGWWSQALLAADVSSEGSTIEEGEDLVYYGTTSFRCALPSRLPARKKGHSSSLSPQDLVALVLKDPHARLSLLRAAQCEAAVRASGTLGVLRAEIAGQAVSQGDEIVMEIVVDVSAEVVLLTEYCNAGP